MATTKKATKAKVAKKAEVKKSGLQQNGSVLTGSLIALAFFVVYGVLVGYAINRSFTHGYNDRTFQGFKKDEDATGGDLPKGYLALFICSIVLAIALIIAFAGGLRGSKGINRSNPFIKGETYIRTKAQTIAFRATTILMALLFLTSFSLDMFFGDLKGAVKDNSGQDSSAASDVLRGVLNYGLDTGAGYYQCFMTSFVLGFIILFKRYNGVKVVGPMGFIGSVRTFGDITDGVGKDGAGDNTQFHRLVMEHLLLIFGPLFIIVANRDRYTLRSIKQTFFYTFMMVFIPYVIYSMVALGSDGKPHADGGGEIDGVASGGKLGAPDTDKGLAEHFHLFFGCMYVPFGLAIVIVLIFMVNFFTYKAEAKGNGGKRGCSVGKEYGQDVKTNQGSELKLSYANLINFVAQSHRDKIKMPQPAPFGVDPKVGEEKASRKRK